MILNAQIIISDPEAQLANSTRDSMYLEALKVASGKRNTQVNFQYCNIIFNENAWHLIPDGHFDVYLWKDGQWKHAYRKDDLGYNFFSLKYLYNNKIYSFGGYGFWRLHSDIISYHSELKEWVICMDYKNVPKGVGIHGQDALIIVSGSDLSVLDLKSGLIRTCQADVLENLQFRNLDFRLSGKNYSVLLEENLQLLIEKPSNKIYTLKIGALNKVHTLKKEDCIHVKSDSILAFNAGLELLFQDLMNVDFHHYTLIECEENQLNTSLWGGLAFGLLLIGLIFGFKSFLNRRSVKNTQPQLPEVLIENISFYNKVIKLEGSILTQDQLDLILEIPEDVSPETKRFRRANLISEINTKSKLLTSKDIIHRMKDPIDKRKYLYKIAH